MEIYRVKQITAQIEDIPADKSISHRCAIFALLSNGVCEIKNFLLAEDTLHSLQIAKQLGLEVVEKGEKYHHFIAPKNGIQESNQILDCGNAGTAMRLYIGLLAGVKGEFVLDGDCYLRVRPMDRVIAPLVAVGANICAKEGSFSPVTIKGSRLEGFDYTSKVASAQIKSAMLLAGLFAKADSVFSEPYLSRNHTEKMLLGMGAELAIKESKIFIKPLKKPLEPLRLEIPSDPSSAFFFAVAGAILPNSSIVLKNILLNPTRIEAFEILKQMGAKIEYEIKQQDFETIGDIYVKSSNLKAIDIKTNIAWLIDEIPALSIAMAVAEGTSSVCNAKELRIKESDRIKAIVSNLSKMGIAIEEKEDGFEICGGELKRARVSSFGDHRIAMSFAIAGLVCGVEIDEVECIKISFPNFLDILQKIVERC